mmetsp:Transcript_68025/g.191736  ORF Transcript_68025/g.191736 Transcript_68025/m.191736 type:complete len:366 (+) Transcript_68025:80-1177(+)
MDSTPFLALDASNAEPIEKTPCRACWLLGAILLACCASFGAVSVCSMTHPIIMSQAALSFVLGLRHAVDCDHLAAIDNVTRQLISRGQRPVSVGFWFALGHSSVVLLMTGLVAGGYSWVLQASQDGDLATDVSLAAALFSVCIVGGLGVLNARIAVELFQDWTRLSKASSTDQHVALEGTAQASLRTALTSIPFLKKFFDRVDRASKMYSVGFLFGLSFDSATQVGLIGLATMSGSHGLVPAQVVMLLPVCFSCGMCLVDTLNGLLMLMTYSWAHIEPVQKLFYNFLVTAMSAGIAVLIGSLELLQIAGEQCGFSGPFWDFVAGIDMASIGYAIILTFFTVFLVTALGRGCRGKAGEDRPGCGDC